MQFHQVLVGAAPHDAITNMAREIQVALARCGDSRIFARHRTGTIRGVEALHRFPGAGSEEGVIVFHASFGDPEVFRFLMGRPEPVVLVFHNISPVEQFELLDPARAAMLLWGRRELELLRSRVAAVVAVSPTNAAELAELGYDDALTHVIPVGVRADRLVATVPDPSAMETLAPFAGAPLLAYAGQVLPHKRIDVLLHMQLALDRIGLRSVLAIAGPPTDPVLHRALTEEARDLGVGRVLFLGALGDDALSALFRQADVLVTASEHEGLCLPAVEAMAMGVPVVARAAGALPDTVGDGGLVLPLDAGSLELAEAVAEVHTDPVLAATLGSAGRRRAAAFDLDTNLARFLDVVLELV